MVLCHTLLYHSEQHGIWSYYVESYRTVWFHMHIHIILDYIVPYTVPNYMVSYRIVLYDLLSLLYHVVSYRTVWYRISIPHRTKACHKPNCMMSYHTIHIILCVRCHIMLCLPLAFYVVSYRTMWQHIYSDPIELQFGIIRCIPNYMVSYHIVQFCIIPYSIVSYYMILYIYLYSAKLQHITHQTIVFCFTWTNSKQLV